MKSFFTQGVCVLLEHALSLDEVEGYLADYTLLGRQTGGKAETWALGGTGIIVVFRPEVRGLVVVDVVERQWPDDIGSPLTDPMVLAAWAMGAFGPFATQGTLARAVQQAWNWPEAGTIVARHQAFLRIRVTYAIGAQENDSIMPKNYAPQPELEFITQLALKLCAAPGALCYFNPNAEIVCNYATLKYAWERYVAGGLRPLDVWSNRRLYNPSQAPGWVLMDTMGMQQLDVQDHEACFRADRYNPDEVARFLINLSEYALSSTRVLKQGDATDGPGALLWQARSYESSLATPARPVLRWLPQDDASVPALFLQKPQ